MNVCVHVVMRISVNIPLIIIFLLLITHITMQDYNNKRVCIHMYMSQCVCMCMREHTCLSVCVCIYMFLCVCMCTHVHVLVCLCVYTLT